MVATEPPDRMPGVSASTSIPPENSIVTVRSQRVHTHSDGDGLLTHEVQRHLTNDNNNTEIERGLVLPRPSHGLVPEQSAYPH